VFFSLEKENPQKYCALYKWSSFPLSFSSSVQFSTMSQCILSLSVYLLVSVFYVYVCVHARLEDRASLEKHISLLKTRWDSHVYVYSFFPDIERERGREEERRGIDY
jgi:hypothetical protein